MVLYLKKNFEDLGKCTENMRQKGLFCLILQTQAMEHQVLPFHDD